MNIAVDILIEKRDKLLAELEDLNYKYGEEIKELNRAIVSLTGKSIPEVQAEIRYDDENPDYIRQSIEEI